MKIRIALLCALGVLAVCGPVAAASASQTTTTACAKAPAHSKAYQCPAMVLGPAAWQVGLYPTRLYMGNGHAPYLTGLLWTTYQHSSGKAHGTLHTYKTACLKGPNPNGCPQIKLRVTVATGATRFHKVDPAGDGGYYYAAMLWSYNGTGLAAPHNWHVSRGYWVVGKLPTATSAITTALVKPMVYVNCNVSAHYTIEEQPFRSPTLINTSAADALYSDLSAKQGEIFCTGSASNHYTIWDVAGRAPGHCVHANGGNRTIIETTTGCTTGSGNEWQFNSGADGGGYNIENEGSKECITDVGNLVTYTYNPCSKTNPQQSFQFLSAAFPLAP